MNKIKDSFEIIGLLILMFVIGLMPLWLVLFFFMALSGKFDTLHKRDVRKYLEEQYAITDARITLIDKPMEELVREYPAATGRIWRIEVREAGGISSDSVRMQFHVIELRGSHAWDGHKLCDDRKKP